MVTKIVYRILSLHSGTPVYRVYNYRQAQDLLQVVKKQWGDKFWLEQQIRRVG